MRPSGMSMRIGALRSRLFRRSLSGRFERLTEDYEVSNKYQRLKYSDRNKGFGVLGKLGGVIRNAPIVLRVVVGGLGSLLFWVGLDRLLDGKWIYIAVAFLGVCLLLFGVTWGLRLC